MVTGSAVVLPVTEQSTREGAPPPVPEPLHCVTVAFVVLDTGEQRTVDAPPPPVPDPMHSFTVAPAVGVPLATSLIYVTLQVTLLPPPPTMPLHWSTEVTS
jgi:hypothetical protein